MSGAPRQSWPAAKVALTLLLVLVGAGVGYLVVGEATGVDGLADHVASPGLLAIMGAMPGILVGAGVGGIAGPLLYKVIGPTEEPHAVAESAASAPVRDASASPPAAAPSSLLMTSLAMGFVGVLLGVGTLYLSSLRLVEGTAATSEPPFLTAGLVGAAIGLLVLGPLVYLRAKERRARG